MSYPEIIYKYRDWDNPLHRCLLLYNELYLASPGDFNDPFDCRITKNFLQLNTREKKDQYIDRIMIRSFDQWGKYVKPPEVMIKEIDERLEDLSKLQTEFETQSFKDNDLHYGVLCFSAIWNNILMWSHYAKSHQGFCVGLYEEKVKFSHTYAGKGSMVIYDTEFPDIDPLMDDNIQQNRINEMFLTTHYKSSIWRYEAEYRVSTLKFPEPFSNIDRVFNFSDDFFAEVILGINMSSLHKREVIDICRRKNIPVYQAQKIPLTFNLTCSLIE